MECAPNVVERITVGKIALSARIILNERITTSPSPIFGSALPNPLLQVGRTVFRVRVGRYSVGFFDVSAYLSAMPTTKFEPCIPTRGTKVPTGPDWIHKIKYDGYRLMVQREGKRVPAVHVGSKPTHDPGGSQSAENQIRRAGRSDRCRVQRARQVEKKHDRIVLRGDPA